MNDTISFFLYGLTFALRGDSVSPDVFTKEFITLNKYPESTEDKNQLLNDVFSLSERHMLLPMLYKSMFQFINDDSLREQIISNRENDYHRGVVSKWEKRALGKVVTQYEFTASFLELYEYLLDQGIKALVVKGIVCRQTYPYPEYRYSWDEDLLILPEEFDACHQALLRYGMKLVSSETETTTSSDTTQSYEIVYRDMTSGLNVEIHRSLFQENSSAYGDFNRYFRDVFEKAVPLIVDEYTVWTMDPSSHFFYLVCHMFKHFLHYGAGMRHLTDILMYARYYGQEICWESVRNLCRGISAELFIAGIFSIGEQYLGFHMVEAGVPGDWIAEATDIDILLSDILEAGMPSYASKSRMHSSLITLDAVSSQKEGKNLKKSVLRSVFPSYSSMAGRYAFLRKVPVLLPFAWLYRIFRYGYELIQKGEYNNTSESLQIGKERIMLMRSQGILNEIVDTKNNSSENQRYTYKKRSEHRIHIKKKETTSHIKKNIGHDLLSDRIKAIGNTSFGGITAPVAGFLWKKVFFLQWIGLDTLWRVQGYHLPSLKERDAVRKNITFIYKSFERKDMAIGLYKNIQKFYPGVNVIIADDSREPLKYDSPFLNILHLPFNSGLSKGIIAALEEVKTPYLMRMDDDELLTRRTNIGKQLRFLKMHSEVDIVTFGFITVMNHHPEKAVWPEYYKTAMNDTSKRLKIRHMTQIDKNHVVLGKGPNIYLAKTEAIRKVGYDENIRMIDHHEFFFRAAGELVTVGALDSFVFHRHNPFDNAYQQYREDTHSDVEYLKKKYESLRNI